MRVQLYLLGLVVGNMSNCTFNPVGSALHAPTVVAVRTSQLVALCHSRNYNQIQPLRRL